MRYLSDNGDRHNQFLDRHGDWLLAELKWSSHYPELTGAAIAASKARASHDLDTEHPSLETLLEFHKSHQTIPLRGCPTVDARSQDR